MTENPKITLYGHPFCASVGPIRRILSLCSVNVEYINIHRDVDGRERVREINNGYESVPTLVFADGSTLTEPNIVEFKRTLESKGIKVPLRALIIGNAQVLLLAGFVVLILLRIVGVL